MTRVHSKLESLIIPPYMQNELSFCMQDDNGRGVKKMEEKKGGDYLA
jgi:hypothetical protein